MIVISQVIMLFLMGAAGYLLVRKKIWNDAGIATLTSVMIYIGTPCLNFSKLYAIPPRTISQDWVLTFLITLPLTCLFLGIGYLIFRKHPKDERAVYAQITAFSNCGFVGYPIMEAVLGVQAVQYGVAFATAFNIVCWSLGLSLFSAHIRDGLKKMVNPTMILTLLGLLFQVTGWRLPAAVSGAVDAFGHLATPVFMLIAGAYFSKLTRDIMQNKAFLAACLLRLTFIPLLAFALLKLLGLSGDAAGAILIATAMPCASNTLAQASAYSTPQASKLAVGGTALTTAASVLTIPVMLELLRFIP